jgi:predicted nucleic acid-binding protein
VFVVDASVILKWLVIDPKFEPDTDRALRLMQHVLANGGEHVFDTLYHAVARETPGAMLVTADERYAKAAGAVGGIIRLAAWIEPEPEPISPPRRARSRST